MESVFSCLGNNLLQLLLFLTRSNRSIYTSKSLSLLARLPHPISDTDVWHVGTNLWWKPLSLNLAIFTRIRLLELAIDTLSKGWGTPGGLFFFTRTHIPRSKLVSSHFKSLVFTTSSLLVPSFYIYELRGLEENKYSLQRCKIRNEQSQSTVVLISTCNSHIVAILSLVTF